jgi:hypothetical protein
MGSEFSSTGHPQSWEGRHIQPSNEQELHEAVSRAFDFRGDVTIQLKTGDQITGYVFDCHVNVPRPYVKVFLPNVIEPHIVSYRDIAGIRFSGEDTAFGRSWEDWAQKWKKLESIP